eukprot:g81915.t1
MEKEKDEMDAVYTVVCLMSMSDNVRNHYDFEMASEISLGLRVLILQSDCNKYISHNLNIPAPATSTLGKHDHTVMILEVPFTSFYTPLLPRLLSLLVPFNHSYECFCVSALLLLGLLFASLSASASALKFFRVSSGFRLLLRVCFLLLPAFSFGTAFDFDFQLSASTLAPVFSVFSLILLSGLQPSALGFLLLLLLASAWLLFLDLAFCLY